MSKKALKEIADVTFFNTETNLPEIFFDTLKVSTIENEAESTSANGGKGNPKLVTWNYNRTATLTMQDALISAKTLGILAGTKVDKTGTKIVHARQKAIVPVGGTVTLENEPVADTVNVMDFGEGELGELVAGSTVSGSEVSGLTAGETVMIYYKRKVDATTQVVTFSTDKFPSTYTVVGDTLMRDAKTNTDKVAQFTIPRAQLQAGFTLTMDVENPSVFDFNLEILKDSDSTDLYEIVIFE